MMELVSALSLLKPRSAEHEVGFLLREHVLGRCRQAGSLLRGGFGMQRAHASSLRGSGCHRRRAGSSTALLCSSL